MSFEINLLGSDSVGKWNGMDRPDFAELFSQQAAFCC